MISFVIIETFVIPLQIGFELKLSEGFFLFEFAISICFIVDIIIVFNTGYYFKGSLVMDRNKIIIRYMKL